MDMSTVKSSYFTPEAVVEHRTFLFPAEKLSVPAQFWGLLETAICQAHTLCGDITLHVVAEDNTFIYTSQGGAELTSEEFSFLQGQKEIEVQVYGSRDPAYAASSPFSSASAREYSTVEPKNSGDLSCISSFVVHGHSPEYLYAAHPRRGSIFRWRVAAWGSEDYLTIAKGLNVPILIRSIPALVDHDAIDSSEQPWFGQLLDGLGMLVVEQGGVRSNDGSVGLLLPEGNKGSPSYRKILSGVNRPQAVIHSWRHGLFVLDTVPEKEDNGGLARVWRVP